jgi:hypothetical protein
MLLHNTCGLLLSLRSCATDEGGQPQLQHLSTYR